jgi:hypothetical protein
MVTLLISNSLKGISLPHTGRHACSEGYASGTKPQEREFCEYTLAHSKRARSCDYQILGPNLDRLAAEGMILADFHATPNCAPTRAVLLTGVDYHRAGLGTMTEVAAPNQHGKTTLH